ncbi:hypothetical protein FB451DRAFT_1449732 [Mycena latifolia]|nr:hypothetical protein FB451DRAFT_1449732 [Mycena latifolia]
MQSKLLRNRPVLLFQCPAFWKIFRVTARVSSTGAAIDGQDVLYGAVTSSSFSCASGLSGKRKTRTRTTASRTHARQNEDLPFGRRNIKHASTFDVVDCNIAHFPKPCFRFDDCLKFWQKLGINCGGYASFVSGTRPTAVTTLAVQMMENTLNAEYEGSLLTPPGSPTPTSAPSLPSATVEEQASVEDLLDNSDTLLGDDGLVSFVANGSMDTAAVLHPPISASQSAVAKPLGRALVGTAPTLAAAQWQTYSLPNCHLESGADLPSVLRPHGEAPARQAKDAFLHHDTSAQHTFLPRAFRGHEVANAAYASLIQRGSYTPALPPFDSPPGLFDAYPPSALTGAPVTIATVARAMVANTAYDAHYTNFSHYTVPPGGIYGTHSTQVTRPRRESPIKPSASGGPQDAHGQLSAYGYYPSNIYDLATHPRVGSKLFKVILIFLIVSLLLRPYGQPPVSVSDIQRFIPASQQFTLSPSSALQDASAAQSSWARARAPRRSANATHISAPSTSRAPPAASSVRLSGAQRFTDLQAPFPTASRPAPAPTGSPGLTARPKKRPAPAGISETVKTIVEQAKPEHEYKYYIPNGGQHAMRALRGENRRSAREAPGPSRLGTRRKEYKAQKQKFANIVCLWAEANTGKPCTAAVSLPTMGSHIARCHLRSTYWACRYCKGLSPDKRTYAAHFERCEKYLAHVKATQGPAQKRRRVDEVGA